MSKNNKYGNIDPEDLFRYLSDGLSEEERYALEREIQKDPFIEEALEGLSALGSEQARKDLTRLRSRLNKRITGRSLMAWVPVAASVVVLLTLGTLYFTVFQDKIGRMDQRVADSESVEEKREKSTHEEPGTLLKEETETAVQPLQVEKRDVQEITEPSPVVVEEQNAQEITEPASPEILSTDDEIEMTDQELLIEDEIIIADEGAFVQDTLEFAMEDEVLADNSGAGDDLKSEVLTTGEEYVTETPPATTMTSRSSIAKPTAMDKGVLGSAAKKQATGSPEKEIMADSSVPDSIPAMPIGGVDLFNQYIKQNIRFPEGDSLPAGGTVLMSFSVDQQGRRGNIVIIETPGDAFSREAVRLLQEGPEWTPVIINGIPADRKTRLSIEFQK